MEDTNEIQKKIEEIEAAMQAADFWSDKNRARGALAQLAELKAKKEGVGKYDRGNAIVNIIAGAGGEDAEDFGRMLFEMYDKYARGKGWEVFGIHANQNN